MHAWRPIRAHGLVAALILLLGAAPAAAAGLVANGGFESGAGIPPAGELLVLPGSDDLAGWTVTGGGIDIVSDIYWVPYQGSRSVHLNGIIAGAVSQTFATTPGAPYTVGFVMTGEPFTTPEFKHLRVSAAGQSADFEFDTAPAWHWDMAWTPHQWTFTATGSTTTLTFQSLDSGPSGPAIDSVEVQPVVAGAPAMLAGVALEPPVPNPVTGPADVAFTLSRAAVVRLSVLDAQGRDVARLAEGERGAGRHVVRWNPDGTAPGVYFVHLRTAGVSVVRRIARAR